MWIDPYMANTLIVQMAPRTLHIFLYILPGARFQALSAGVHCTLRVAG